MSNARDFANLSPGQVPWALVDMGGGSSYISLSQGDKIPFDNVVQSNGSHFDTTNNRFTCPVAGVYSITWSILSYSNSDAYHVEVYKNTTDRIGRGYVVYRGNRGTLEYKFAANDFIEFYTDTISVYPDTATQMYSWANFRLVG